jgi:hypothetical protein
MSDGLERVRGKLVLAPPVVSDFVGVATAEERIGKKGAGGGGVDDRQAGDGYTHEGEVLL